MSFAAIGRVARYERLLALGEFENNGDENIVIYFKILSRHSPGETEKNHLAFLKPAYENALHDFLSTQLMTTPQLSSPLHRLAATIKFQSVKLRRS